MHLHINRVRFSSRHSSNVLVKDIHRFCPFAPSRLGNIPQIATLITNPCRPRRDGCRSQLFFTPPTRQYFHSSTKTQVEDPQAFKPPNYPEAEWAKLNDEFEQTLMKRSWFFRPIFRLVGHPKYHIGNLTFQFVLLGSLVSGWIYIWFFMDQAGKPPATDGTGRLLNNEEIEESEAIENYLHSHPVVQAIRSQKHLVESRPHWAIPDKDIPYNLTGGTLRGLGRVSVAPIAFADGEGTELYAVLHIGRDLCGHGGTVHNGILATILDESLARCCFPALPNRIGVTANLSIDYKVPIPADSYLLVRV